MHQKRFAASQSLTESLILLQEHLDQARLLVNQQSALADHPGSIGPLASALASCKVKVERLMTVSDGFQKSLVSPSRFHRKWGSLKIVCKKDEIDSHQSQIRDAIAMLQSAILINIALTTNVYEYSIHSKFFTEQFPGFTNRYTTPTPLLQILAYRPPLQEMARSGLTRQLSLRCALV